MGRDRFAVIVSAIAVLVVAPSARAQTDMASMAHRAAANQLGILEFCQNRGDVGADAVSAQKTSIGRLPQSSVSTDGDESLGRSGTLAAPNGQTMTLANIAAQHGSTVSAMCKQLGSSAVQSASAGAGGTMAMPSLPGGMKMPSMPSMPGGMSMPSMPAVPGTGSGGAGSSQ